MKYNFIVFATYANLYKYMWQELEDIDNVKVYWDKEELLPNLSAEKRVRTRRKIYIASEFYGTMNEWRNRACYTKEII